MSTMIAPYQQTLKLVGDGPQPDKTAPSAQTPYIELPTYGVAPPDRKWLLDAIIAQLDAGQFQSAGPLADAMLRDGRIMAAFEQRNSAVFGKPVEIEPADDSAEAERARDEIAVLWDEMFPRSTMEELSQYGVLMGVGIAEKEWDTSVRPWKLKLRKAWHPRYYQWRWDLQCYTLITLDRGLICIPQSSTQWITYTPYGYQRGYLHGRIRALVDPWMGRGWDHDDWSHYNEIHGHPIRKAIVPQQATPAQEREFVRSIANMGSNTTVKTRQDKDGNKYDLELVEAMGDSWKSFEAKLALSKAEISEVLLGQSQSTDGQGGLGAQEKPGEGVRADISASDSAKICEAIRSQALREFCFYNYGNADLAPRPRYATEPPEDTAKATAADKNVADTLVSFKNADAPIDVRAYLEQRGYPLITPEQEAQMKAERKAEEAEQAALEMAQSTADRNWVEAGMMMPEEAVKRRFKGAGALGIDTESRERIVVAESAPKSKRARKPKDTP